MDTLDIESLNDEKYMQPFYLTLRDSKHESWNDRDDGAKHRQKWTKKLGEDTWQRTQKGYRDHLYYVRKEKLSWL